MSRVTDSTGKAIGYLFWDLVNGEQSETVVLSVEAAAASQFICTASPVVTLYARESGVGSFVPLANGIDLSGYTPGDVILFDLFAVGTVATGRGRDAIFVGVIDEAERAGWSEIIAQPALLVIQNDADPVPAFFFRESDMRYLQMRPSATPQFYGYLDMATVSTGLRPYARMSYARRGSGGFGAYSLRIPFWDYYFQLRFEWDLEARTGKVYAKFSNYNESFTYYVYDYSDANLDNDTATPPGWF